MGRCPHCGERLPEVVDAFCPECRQPLDDLPPSAVEGLPGKEASATAGIISLAGLGWMGVGLLVLLTTHAIAGLLMIGAGVALLITGLWWGRVSALEE